MEGSMTRSAEEEEKDESTGEGCAAGSAQHHQRDGLTSSLEHVRMRHDRVVVAVLSLKL